MSKMNNALFALCALVIFFCATAGTGQAQKTQPSPTPSPTPTVNAIVINTPEVKVANTPRTLNANDLQPYQVSNALSSTGNQVFAEFSVPEGKRLVIEYISVRLTLAPGEEADSYITLIGPDFLGSQYQLILSPQRKSSTDVVVSAAQKVKIYQMGGTTFTVMADRYAINGGNVSGRIGMNVSVSGYLVDLP